jgi:hypothetical protein
MNEKWKNVSIWIKSGKMDENVIDECMNPQYMLFSV